MGMSDGSLGQSIGVTYPWGEGNETSWLEWDNDSHCWTCVSYVPENRDGFDVWNEKYERVPLSADLAASVAALAGDGGSIRVDDNTLEITLFLSELATALGAGVADIGDAVELTVNGARIEHAGGRLVIEQ